MEILAVLVFMMYEAGISTRPMWRRARRIPIMGRAIRITRSISLLLLAAYLTVILLLENLVCYAISDLLRRIGRIAPPRHPWRRRFVRWSIIVRGTEPRGYLA